MNEQSRRGFLKQTVLLAASIPCMSLLGKTIEADAQAEGPVPVPDGQIPVLESDPVASVLGFHHDAKKTDYSRYPERKKPSSENHFCKSCVHYTMLNKGWGKCEVITSGVVSAQGWCGSWSQKTS